VLQNRYKITHFTLGMLLHYLGKLKIQMFCKPSANMEENANTLHFKCIFTHVTAYAECIYVLF